MPSWYNCKFTSYLPWLVPGWMILVALSNAFHEIMKKTKIFRQFLNTSKFRSQPLGNFLGFLGLPLQLKVWGGFRRFRKTHLENIIPRESRDRDTWYPKGVQWDQIFLLNVFFSESYLGVCMQVWGLLK